ncbi:MAG TPA: hypothetical protein VK590_10415, partial [Saprospiraceae bacterium]|nr:hypothetical protein [Saprospiraceae bacterium]
MRNIIFGILIFPFLLTAQQHERQILLDSLIQKISYTRNDTNKVIIFDKISFLYSNSDPDKGIKYALQAKTMAEKLAWTKGIAAGYADLGINFEAQSYHSKALENHMLALNMYEKQNLKNEM